MKRKSAVVMMLLLGMIMGGIIPYLMEQKTAVDSKKFITWVDFNVLLRQCSRLVK